MLTIHNICITSCYSKPEAKNLLLLSKKRGLYNIRHIKDLETIELESRVSPTSHPPQSSEEMILVRPQSKTIPLTMCELSSLPPHISGCGEDESYISG